LEGAGLRTPTALHVNGYLTVNGEKMSKSRGTFIQARTYLDAGLNPDYLRYYFATMLSAAPTDVDLDLKAFEERVNSHLVGKWVNIASRCAGFVHKFFGGRLGVEGCFGPDEKKWFDHLLGHHDDIANLYRVGEFAEVTRKFVYAADLVNTHIANNAPWLLAKDETKRGELHAICTFALSAFALLSTWLRPMVPAAAEKADRFLGLTTRQFDDIRAPLYGHEIQPFEPIATRIDAKQIEAMIEASKDSLSQTPSPPNPPLEGEGSRVKAAARAKAAGSGAVTTTQAANSATTISIDDFAKLDLRIGKVLQCGFVDGSDKLLRFELDAGELGKRQIFSGIRASYQEPEKLVGRKVVFIANLAPRKMRFGVSEGMILSAGSDGGLFLLDVDSGAAPGMPVK
jgi:methionyl-tRNA synthetase